MRAVAPGLAVEDVGVHERRAFEIDREIVFQSGREVERLALGNIRSLEQFGIAMPADFDAAEQIRLRPRHAEDAFRLERRVLAENLRVGMEAHLGAAPVRRAADLLQLALRLAALERHFVQRLVARDLDLEPVGEGVGDRDADAVQAAGGLVDLGVEFAARMQRRHDDFERGLVLELRMRIDRDAAAVIVDADKAAGFQFDLDPGGVAGQRLVHGVVDHFREQMMQRLLVGAADIHAGAAAHRLEPLQHLDMLGGVAAVRAARFGRLRVRPGGLGSGFGRGLRGRLGGGFGRSLAEQVRLAAGAAGIAGFESGFGHAGSVSSVV